MRFIIYDYAGEWDFTFDRMEAIKIAWKRWRETPELLREYIQVKEIHENKKIMIDWERDLNELFNG